MTCDPMNGDQCEFDKHFCVITGDPLYWPHGKVEVWADSAGSPLRGITGAQTVATMKRAYAAWLNAQCENGDPPALDVTVMGQVKNASIQYNEERGATNHNVVLYDDAEWTFGSNAIAITTMTFDVNSGKIVDGDTELNSLDYAFALNPEQPQDVDVQAVITHEGGHVLGLAHSDVSGATMQAEAPGTSFVALRTLAADDVAGICTIYDPTKTEMTGRGCSLSRRSRASNLADIVGALALIVALRFRRNGVRAPRRGSCYRIL